MVFSQTNFHSVLNDTTSSTDSDTNHSAIFALRKHRRQLAKRRELHKGPFRSELSDRTCARIFHLLKAFASDYSTYYKGYDALFSGAYLTVCRQLGLYTLDDTARFNGLDSIDKQRRRQFLAVIQMRSADVELIYSMVEAFWIELRKVIWEVGHFEREVQQILEDGEVDHDFINGKFIPRSEQVMHEEVVQPTVTLLSGRPDLQEAESLYMDTLRSIREQRYDDAITHATSALEDTFRTLGCGDETENLKKRGEVAISRGLLASHDKPLLGWVTADRGAKGNAHGRGHNTSRADAWFTLHIVGALILRLAEGPNRGS
ncbi:hypothetical protein [Candidatus Poriferisocius sp.]|uniref:hypothetical protein n=1 Tax=Candidatus Poriferisocius sp. TaxID=3101276 RepID=UPI003B5C3172